MSFAFVCAKQDEDAWPDEYHTTSTAMVRCPRCAKYAVAGYWCDTCGHKDVDKADELTGHGPDHCKPSAD